MSNNQGFGSKIEMIISPDRVEWLEGKMQKYQVDSIALMNYVMNLFDVIDHALESGRQIAVIDEPNKKYAIIDIPGFTDRNPNFVTAQIISFPIRETKTSDN